MFEDYQNIAVVLPGGNSKGAFQVGALEVLYKAGLRPRIFSGVSVGALNAALAASIGGGNLWHIWQNIRKEDIYVTPRFFSKVRSLYRLLRHRGLRDMSPLASLLKAYVKAIPDDVVVLVGACNMGQNQYRTYSSQTTEIEVFHKAVLASASIPFVVPPVSIDDYDHLDGGIINVAPIGDVLKYDPDLVVIIPNEPVVPLGQENLPVQGRTGSIPLLEVADRLVKMMTTEIFRNDLDRFLMVNALLGTGGSSGKYRYYTHLIVAPEVGLGAGEDFSLIAWRYEMGKEAARRQLNQWRVADA